MGGSIERFLSEIDKPREDEPQRKGPISRWADDDEVSTRLSAADTVSAKQTPSQAARVLTLSKQTGLDPGIVERQQELVEQESKRASFDTLHFQQEYPNVAKWLAQQPQHLALARNDLHKLGYIERQVKNIGDQVRRNRRTVELAQIGDRAMFGKDTPEDRRRETEIEQELGGPEPDYGFKRRVEQVPGYAIGNLPILLETAKSGIKGAALGGLAGVGTALAVGAAIPVPEEALTAPVLGIRGAIIGGKVGMGIGAGLLEARLAFLQYRKLKDDNGITLSHETALGAAAIVGVVNGALEMVALKALAKNVPGLRSLGRESVQRALRSQTTQQAFTRYAKAVGEAMIAEGSTEFLQSLMTATAGAFAKMAANGEIKVASRDAILDSVMEALGEAEVGALAGGGLSAVAGSTALPADIRRAQDAQKNVEFFKGLGEAVKDAEIVKLAPEKAVEAIEALVKGGPVENVYTPIETFREYWQSKEIDPAEVAEELLGSREAYDQAVETGAKLAIPTARYATYIAGTPHHEFFVNELAPTPDAMSARESDEFAERMDEEASLAEEAEPDNVQSQMVEQLRSAGFTPEQAESQATLYGEFFRTMGARTGIDPMELFSRYRLTVERDQMTGPPLDVRTMPLEELAKRAMEMRAGVQETAAERVAVQAEASTVVKENLYAIPREKREASTTTPEGQLAYARDKKGAPLKSFKNVSTEGLVEEIAYLLEQQELDSRQATMSVIERVSEPYYKPWVGMKGGAIMASGRIKARQKTIDRAEVELASRGVEDANERIFARMMGREFTPEGAIDTSFDFALEQRQGEIPRGRIKVGKSSMAIELLKDANLSTFLHETGHFYLEVLDDLSRAPNADGDIVADMQTIRAWLGADEGQAFTREHHEQWARGFERYLLEGKAPSAALREAFAKFRAWLVFIYRSIRNLDVELTPEVRGVFDRLLATETEIAAAEAEQVMVPLFPDPATLGIPQETADAYTRDILAAREEARDELSAKLIAGYQKERSELWKAERVAVRAEVANEINLEPVSLAYSVLGRGRLPDGSEIPDSIAARLRDDEGNLPKLSKQALEAEYATRPEYQNLLKRLPRPYVYSKAGGIHPDQAAEIFGFRSGDELIQALLVAEEPRRRIDRIADERMRERHVDELLTPEQVTDEAMKAVHNEKLSQVLDREIRILGSQSFTTVKGLVRLVAHPLPTSAEVRAQAQAIIARMTIRDVRPIVFQRAGQKASRAAIQAFNKGDIELARDEKIRQRLNLELYRAATQARDGVIDVVKNMARFDKPSTRARIGKAGGDYLDQIDGIRERYDFARGLSRAQVQKRKRLTEFVAEQRAEGKEITVPDALLEEAGRTHYTDLTVEELRGLAATVEQIEHLSTLKNRLLLAQQSRTVDEARQAMIASMAANHDITGARDSHAPGIRRLVKQGVRAADAPLTRMEFLFEYLDGNKALGPVWQHLYRGLAEAENTKMEMLKGAAEAIQTIMGQYTRKERAKWTGDRFYVREAETAKVDGQLNHATILMMALNWGNEGNRTALMEGYGYTEAQVQLLLDRLSAKDLQMIQGVFDHLASYKEAAFALQKEMTGLAPESVEPVPIVTANGTIPGGYFPIVFDRTKSTRQEELDATAELSESFGHYGSRAMTRHGHLENRTNSGGKPIKLDLGVIGQHVTQVVHDLAYRRAVVDAWRLVNDPQIQKAIEGAAGLEMYQQLKPWLKDIAADRPTEPHIWWEKILRRARLGATVVNLGLRVTTSLLQTLGYFNTIKELGPKYALSGIRDVFGGPTIRGNPLKRLQKKWDFITERSPMMRDRLLSYDRDVRDYITNNKFGMKESTWFVLIGYMDLATSVPTWIGAYQKAMDGKMENVEKGNENDAIAYADSLVRMTQSAGATKDLPAVMRSKNEGWRLFTMHFSSMNLIYQQFAKTKRQYTLDHNRPKLFASLFLIWFLPVALEEMIRGDGPPGDDDDAAAWAKYLARKMFFFPFSTVIFLRDIMNAVEWKAETGRTSFQGSPAGGVGEATGTTIYTATKVFTDEEITRKDVKDAMLAVGYWTKLPGRQVYDTSEALYDWWTGEYEPESVFEGVKAVVTGKPRD
jgi:hypothetical protein